MAGWRFGRACLQGGRCGGKGVLGGVGKGVGACFSRDAGGGDGAVAEGGVERHRCSRERSGGGSFVAAGDDEAGIA